MTEQIRVRMLITIPDPISARLWMVVRQDLGNQVREYFHYGAELQPDRDGLTIMHVAVSAGVARVGLHAPAFVQAVGNMLREYQLPQRFVVRLAILGLSGTALTHNGRGRIHNSNDLVPAVEGVRAIETATLDVPAAYVAAAKE